MAIVISSEDQRSINTMLMDFHTARHSLSGVRTADEQSARTVSTAVETLRTISNRFTGLGIEFRREEGFDDE